jgi:hypothetical protein
MRQCAHSSDTKSFHDAGRSRRCNAQCHGCLVTRAQGEVGFGARGFAGLCRELGVDQSDTATVLIRLAAINTVDVKRNGDAILSWGQEGASMIGGWITGGDWRILERRYVDLPDWVGFVFRILTFGARGWWQKSACRTIFIDEYKSSPCFVTWRVHSTVRMRTIHIYVYIPTFSTVRIMRLVTLYSNKFCSTV